MFSSQGKRISLILLALGVIPLVFARSSFAEILNLNLPLREGIKIGELKAHSALTVSPTYDSNIFLAPNDEKSDYITVINPSIGFELPMQDNSLNLEYNAFINEYSKHNDENHVDHKIEALGKIALTDYTINLSDLFNRFTNRRDNETSVRLRQMTNDARVGVMANFDQLSFDVGYSYKILKYLSDAAFFGPLTYKDRDYTEHVIDATGAYRFMPKTSVLLETDLGVIKYDHASSPDAKFIQLLTGLRGNPSDDLSLNLRAGVKHQEYKSSSILNDDNFTGFVAKGGADYNFSPDDRLSLGLERGIYESIYQNMNYYVLNQAGLNYKHNFTHKLAAGLSGAYQLNTYPKQSTEGAETKKRSDKTLLAGAQLTYNVRKWLTVGLDYSYTKRDSNFNIYDYTDNLVMLNFTAGF